MVRNVFRLDERQLGSLTIPRSDIVHLDIRLPNEENLRRVIESKHSRFPVCDGGFDKVLGVIHARQVLACIAKGRAPDFGADLEAAAYLPETLTGMDVLEHFRTHDLHVAFVVDEYGNIEGIVTMHDVLEALTGEFTPRDAGDAWAVPVADGAWLLDGAMPIPEAQDKLDLRHVPHQDRARYHTLAGMMMLLLGRVPLAGEHAQWEGWQFEIVAMNGKRIDKILARQVTNVAA